MQTRRNRLWLSLIGLVAALTLAGCGSTSGNGGPGDDSDMEIDNNQIDNGQCSSDAECTGGDRCIGTGGLNPIFICGAPNEGGGEVGTTCNSDAECAQNFCEAGQCESPRPPRNPDIIVGNGGTCSWIDDPQSCTGWQCRSEGSQQVCRHNHQPVPSGSLEWECFDSGSNTICKAPGDKTGDGLDPLWDCTYSGETDTTVCTNYADFPDDRGENIWECSFANGGNTKVCTAEGEGIPTGDCPAGNIEGTACTPTGVDVSGATVTIDYIDCDGNQQTATTETDALGYFVIPNVPVGDWDINIKKGPYSRNDTVSISEGETTSYTDGGGERLCFDPHETRIAVVGGAYDAIGEVLDALGFEYDYYNGVSNWEGWNFLLDANTLDQYDIVYINCGVHPEAAFGQHMSELNTIGSNLRNFVDSGHYVYASDWAYYFVEAAYPDKIDYLGEDLSAPSVLVGQSGDHAVAVTNVEMEAYTGLSTALIDLDLPQWAVATGVSADTNVFLRGDARLVDGQVVNDVPFLADFRSGDGQVAYTSYHIHANQAVNDFFAFIALNFK